MNRIWVALTLAALAGPLAAEDEEVRRLTEDSRKVAGQLIGQIRSELMREMELSGPLRSVVVCKYSVPELTSALSRKTGMRVTRVSLRSRNPSLAAPDPWEQKVLMDFERRLAKGEKAEAIEFGEIVAEPMGRYFRYMKAIPMAPVCLTCHGPAETLSEGMKAQLNAEYPHDRAVGYSVGQIRGAVTVKRAL